MNYDKANYSKLVSAFTDEHTLIERLRYDILLTYRNVLSITISLLKDIKTEQSTISLNEDPLLFSWNQSFIYYLVNSSDVDMEKLKKDMIEQCQLEYSDNKTQLNHISTNENCTEDNVLDWYTKDSFVYRLVNRAFRTRNLDLICRFRYVLILLHNKLKKLAIEQQGTYPTTVYRGQMMKTNELETLQSNIGNLISFKKIISTSRDQSIARGLIANVEIRVIFKINIERTSDNILHPLGDILRFSSKRDEEEILFFAGAVFCIDSVDKEGNSKWVIKLTLRNETLAYVNNSWMLLKSN